MLDLISTTEEVHYENYRQAQMEVRKFGEQKPRKFENPKFKEEEEALRKRFTEQVKAEEARFRQWEQHVRSESCLLVQWLIFLVFAAHSRARPSQQGPRDGTQRDQGARGRAGQPSSRLRPRHGKAVILWSSVGFRTFPRVRPRAFLVYPSLPDGTPGRFFV